MIQNQTIRLDDYQPHPRNYNVHSDDQIRRLAKSLTEFGQVRSLVVWQSYFLAGHGVVEAAHTLGWTELRADVLPDDWPEAKALAYLVADNELARRSDPDQAQLAAILEDLQAREPVLVLAAGYTNGELEALLRLVREPTPVDAEPQIDRASELQQKWNVHSGQLWALGEHRLICGDATDVAVVARVMDGERADLLFTSPPYAEQRDYDQAMGEWLILMQGVFANLLLRDDAQVLVNLGLVHDDGEWQPYWQEWIEWMRGQGWRRFGWYVWDQGPGLPGDWSGRLAPAFEFIFHFNKIARKPNKTKETIWGGAENHGSGLRGKDNKVRDYTHVGQAVQERKIPDSVIRAMRHKARGIEVAHPAVFSVELAKEMIEAYSSPRALIYDPFAGSGTTGIACQNLGRRARMIEISPAYCAVALERFFTATGKQPHLLESPLPEVA